MLFDNGKSFDQRRPSCMTCQAFSFASHSQLQNLVQFIMVLVQAVLQYWTSIVLTNKSATNSIMITEYKGDESDRINSYHK